MTLRPGLVTTLLAVIAGSVPGAAQAHLVSTGLGPFYDGLTHFILSAEDVLPALALALLAGLNGADAGRTALLALPAAWFTGGLLGLVWPTNLVASPLLTTVSLLVLGAMVAANLCVRSGWALALAVVVGGLHGYLNGSAMAQTRLGLTGLIGIVATVFTTVALASALVVALRAPWSRMVVRVGGSWMAAAGLLMLGWSVRAT
jgi:hydrogenase/urease accessory protein HupE